MKGMKKLFALLAVLTMALTLTPMVTPVAAADTVTITLEPNTATLFVGESVQLQVKVNNGIPAGAYNFLWSATPADTATVIPGNNGAAVVKALAEGKATITATVKDSSGSTGVATAVINVIKKPTEPSELKATLVAEQDENLDPIINATVTFTTTTASVGDEYVLGVKITTDPALDGKKVTATLAGTPSSANITSDATVIVFPTASLNKISATAIKIGFYDGANLLKLETATTVTVAILGVNSSTSTTIVEKAVTLEPHTLKLDAPTQIVLTTGETKSFTITASLEKVDATLITASSATVVSANESVVTATIEQTATAFTLTATAGGSPGSTYVTVTVSVTYADSEYTASVNIPVIVSQPAVGVSLYNANGSWVWAGSQLYYKVTYDVVGGIGMQDQVVQLIAGNKVVGYAQLGQPVYATFADLYNEMDGKDGFLTLRHVGGTSSVTVPITFYSVDSELKSSYVSGEPINDVTGEITTVKSGQELSTATIGLSLVAVWKDEDGVAHATNLGNITANRVADDKTTATFAIKAGDIRFTTVPAGNVYLVSENIADGMETNGKVYGVSVAKYAYKTITITQGKLVANPSTVNAPAQNKEIYLYDQFGYPLANTPIKVQYGYKDADGKAIPAATATTNAEGKVTLNFPQPYAYGTYTATISTVKTTLPYVDGVVALTVSYAGGFALGDIDYADNATAIVPVTIGLGSTGASIKKLWITVEDPNKVLYPYYDRKEAANGDYVDIALKPASGFDLTFEYANADACGVKVSDYYWKTATPVNAVNLTGLAVQGGSFKVTVKAELTDGTFVTDTATYIVKNYRVDSITPASTTYGTATTVKIVVKDWYGSYADNLDVKLVGPDNTYIFIKSDFGTYTYTIPASAPVGSYNVYINGVKYSTAALGNIFKVQPVLDLKVTAPATVNAMSSFNVAVTDKDGNPINGTWYIVDPIKGSPYTVLDGYVVSGQFTVNTANFGSGSRRLPLGEYTLVVTSADGAHRAKVTFNVIAPATITPTVVTNGLKSSFVVQMTATGMSASMLKLRETSRAVLQVVNDKFNPESVTTISVPYYNLDVSGQTATITVTAHKMRACSNAVVRLLYGNFIIPTTVAVEHPQLSFVNTATLYAGDVVPVQVKLVDALGNPVKGAVIKLYQLGYYEYTATTNAEGIAEFGNITLSVAGNMVAELVFGPDQQRVIDYRLIGQTDNTNYKIVAQILPARPAQGLKVTVTPTIVDAGKDALLTLTLVGADDKPVETGKNVVVTIGPSTYNGLVGANGVVTLTVKAESLTGTVVTGVVKVEGYNAATFTLAVKEAEKPEVKTLIELAPGMDVYSVNGETKFWDATPYIKNGRTLVPIRHLAEAIGFKASWDFDDPANKMVFIFKADQDPEKDKEHPFILLIIGQPTAMVNGNLVALDVAPEILNGRTMVPLRFVVETLGYKVEWLGNTIRLMK